MIEPKVPELVREAVGDTTYEYYPLGEYVVVAPGVCGGRPTFKYTRLEVSTVLVLLAEGRSIDEVVAEYTESRLETAAMVSDGFGAESNPSLMAVRLRTP